VTASTAPSASARLPVASPPSAPSTGAHKPAAPPRPRDQVGAAGISSQF
jgi:hypothetical protein